MFGAAGERCRLFSFLVWYSYRLWVWQVGVQRMVSCSTAYEMHRKGKEWNYLQEVNKVAIYTIDLWIVNRTDKDLERIVTFKTVDVHKRVYGEAQPVVNGTFSCNVYGLPY